LLVKADLQFHVLTSSFKSQLFHILRVPVAAIRFFVVDLTLNHLKLFLKVEDDTVEVFADLLLP
jgi:hypothetical protein